MFDEGVTIWGPGALAHGFRFLPMEGEIMARMEEIGFQRATLSASRLSGLKEDVPCLNIGGFPIVVHADMPESVAYAICDAIERRKSTIPIDKEGELDMAQLCRNDEEAPRSVPLHPGAERLYRERGYLSRLAPYSKSSPGIKSAIYAWGLMFWLRLKKFVGSNLFFSATNRTYFTCPWGSLVRGSLF